MIVTKIKIINFKIFQRTQVDFNETTNIFVGENGSGKSTLLEAINLPLTGKLNGVFLENLIKPSIFNDKARDTYIKSIKAGMTPEPPLLNIELFFKDDDQFARFKGTNNSNGEDCPGILLEVKMDQKYDKEYKLLLGKNEITDIPIEFYKVERTYFSSDPVIQRTNPFKSFFVDGTKKDYLYTISKFVYANLDDILSPDEKIDLQIAYRSIRTQFKNNEVIQKLNTDNAEKLKIAEKKVELSVKESRPHDWEDELSIMVEKIPFDSVGFGLQKIIKMELALKSNNDSSCVVLFEEPENNLSFTNMSKLVSRIEKQSDKQKFISTHSSYVANKLGLGKLLLVYSGSIKPMHNINEKTLEYFIKLPGYDTLRIVLAEKIILVEGPTDELIVQRAYRDQYGKLPVEDGIDVIVVDSLAFKRFLDIAVLLHKRTAVMTDNDHDIQNNIINKYKDYITEDYLEFFYEEKEELNTIEPSVLAVNETEERFKNFKSALSKNGSLRNYSKDQILTFMTENKSEWAFRVFESDKKIAYPKYILEAVEYAHKE